MNYSIGCNCQLSVIIVHLPLIHVARRRDKQAEALVREHNLLQKETKEECVCWGGGGGGGGGGGLASSCCGRALLSSVLG